MDEEFSTADELKAWLLERKVNEKLLGNHAVALFEHGFITKTSLLGISSDDLKAVGLSIPVAQEMHNKLEQQQQKGGGSVPAFSKALLNQLWKSVFRVENTANGELATALVFDIFQDDNEVLYMLLLLNKHFTFKTNEVIRALQYDEADECSLVEAFTKRTASVYAEGDMKRGEDFVIYQLKLNQEEWELVEPGTAQRIVTEPRAKKRAASTRAEMKKTSMICKTPRYSYIVERSMPVRIFGFPHTSSGRWEGMSTVTSIGRSTFGLQMLSAPGLSGGAVVATSQGDVVGVMGGNEDALDEGNPQLFNAYAIDARSFPKRPSSQPSSPDRENQKVAAATQTKQST